MGLTLCILSAYYASTLLNIVKRLKVEERWLTVEDICAYLNVSNDTVYRWIEQNDMPAHKVGRRWMFQKQEIDDWVKEGKAAEKSEKDNK